MMPPVSRPSRCRTGLRRGREPAALLPPSFTPLFFLLFFLLRHDRFEFTASSNCTHDFPPIGRRRQILHLRFSGFSLPFKRRPGQSVTTSAPNRGRGDLESLTDERLDLLTSVGLRTTQKHFKNSCQK